MTTTNMFLNFGGPWDSLNIFEKGNPEENLDLFNNCF